MPYNRAHSYYTSFGSCRISCKTCWCRACVWGYIVLYPLPLRFFPYAFEICMEAKRGPELGRSNYLPSPLIATTPSRVSSLLFCSSSKYCNKESAISVKEPIALLATLQSTLPFIGKLITGIEIQFTVKENVQCYRFEVMSFWVLDRTIGMHDCSACKAGVIHSWKIMQSEGNERTQKFHD